MANNTPAKDAIIPRVVHPRMTVILISDILCGIMKQGLFPRRYLDKVSALTVAISTGNKREEENLLTSSSSTKIVPAIGALNVAAIAEPAPAAISLFLLWTRQFQLLVEHLDLHVRAITLCRFRRPLRRT